jgi:hypothetical protein
MFGHVSPNPFPIIPATIHQDHLPNNSWIVIHLTQNMFKFWSFLLSRFRSIRIHLKIPQKSHSSASDGITKTSAKELGRRKFRRPIVFDHFVLHNLVLAALGRSVLGQAMLWTGETMRQRFSMSETVSMGNKTIELPTVFLEAIMFVRWTHHVCWFNPHCDG